jgi:UDP-glucose 4-epimerase
MRFLVTGGGGYLGRRLIPLLLRAGRASLLDRSEGFRPEGASFMKGDIRDPSIDLSGFDVVFHLAAMSLPSMVEKDRDAAWDVNVNGTMNICRRLSKGQRLVFMSSSHVYDKSLAAPHGEGELPGPSNFYGLTKLVGEQVVRFHSRQQGFSHAILRLFNSYSADQPKGLIIGDVTEKYRSGGTVEISNPEAVLDMVHADDAVKVIAGAASFDEGTYNVCSGHPVTVGEIYRRVKERVGAAAAQKEVVVSDKGYRMLGDNSKVRALGYAFREFSLD